MRTFVRPSSQTLGDRSLSTSNCPVTRERHRPESRPARSPAFIPLADRVTNLSITSPFPRQVSGSSVWTIRHCHQGCGYQRVANFVIGERSWGVEGLPCEFEHPYDDEDMFETTSYPGETAECAATATDALASVRRLGKVSSNLTDGCRPVNPCATTCVARRTDSSTASGKGSVTGCRSRREAVPTPWRRTRTVRCPGPDARRPRRRRSGESWQNA